VTAGYRRNDKIEGDSQLRDPACDGAYAPEESHRELQTRREQRYAGASTQCNIANAGWPNGIAGAYTMQ
jgi:hypothetical protein